MNKNIQKKNFKQMLNKMFKNEKIKKVIQN